MATRITRFAILHMFYADFSYLSIYQGLARPDLDHLRLKSSEPQWRDRDWKWQSLNNETETEKSKSQWRDGDWKDVSLNDETETEIANVWVSMTRPRLKNLSLNDGTETEIEKIWVLETRLGQRCRYRDSIETIADIWLPRSGEGNDLYLCTIWCCKKQT